MKNHKGEEIVFDRGFATSELQDWEQFQSLLTENQNFKGYIFRGHRCSTFKLEASMVRVLKDKGRKLDAKDLGQHLLKFRLAIRGRISLPERELLSASELWSIGQHHGLATPLLDWTTSPLFAAFFAFEETRGESETRSVFALDARRINEVFFKRLRENLAEKDARLPDKLAELLSFAEELPDYGLNEPAGIVAERITERLLPADLRLYLTVTEAMDATETEVPRIISPLSGENARLVNQRGLFTKFTGTMPLEEWVSSYFDEGDSSSLYYRHGVLLKVNIPNAERASVLSVLDTANINHLSLFPDLEGAAQFANSKL